MNDGSNIPLTNKQEKLLNDIYYGQKYFFGRDKLFKLQEIREAGITRRQVATWLSKQELHQMMLPKRRSKNIVPTVISDPKSQIEVDLIDMTSSADKGYKWILTGYDMFTKFGYAIPLKSKEEKTVTDGMKKLLEQSGNPKVIRSDNGSEFISESFRKLLEDKGIKQVLGTAGHPQTQGGVERFNGILKRLIKMEYLHTGTRDWAKNLPLFLRNYNNSYQRVIKTTPAKAEVAEDLEEISKNIKKEISKLNYKENQKFNVGDKVRVKLEYKDNEKKGENWSKDLYTVNKVLKPSKPYSVYRYRLADLDGTYMNNDLQLVKHVENPIGLPEMYEISKLERPSISKGVHGYIVHWKGYKEKTFEPREQLVKDVPKIVEAFEKAHNVKWFPTRYTWDRS